MYPPPTHAHTHKQYLERNKSGTFHEIAFVAFHPLEKYDFLK